MSETFIKKNIKLFLEFDSYISSRPDLFMKIPNKGIVIITVKGDEKFNQLSRSLVVNMNPSKKKVVEARKEGSRWRILSPAHI